MNAIAKDFRAVVIDSTVVYSDPRLRRAYARVVRSQAARGTFKLVVPEVVVQESVNKLRTRSEEAYEGMKKHADEIARLGLPPVVPDGDTRKANVTAYEEELRRVASNKGCEIGAIPAISHDNLVPKAVAKAKPFGPKGTGYRDALIWENVLAEAAGGPVAFISNNTADFCNADETGLADDLVDELQTRGLLRDQVTWYRDLKSFVDDAIPAAARTVEEVRDLLQNDPDFQHSTFALVAETATDLKLYDDWETGRAYSPLYLPTDSTEPTITWYEVRGVEIDDAHEGADGEIVLELMSRGEAQIEFFAPKWSAFSEATDISIEDGDWNEWSVWAMAYRDMDLQLTVSYDPETKELSSSEITAWDAVERLNDG
jgi:PIN domain